MVDLTEALFVVGRILFGGFFVFNAINHFTNREAMTGYAAAKGMPAPGLAVLGTGLLLLLGGLSVLLGILPEVGLTLLVAFLVGITPVMHAFWKETDEQQKVAEMTQFMKNAALLGATLALYAVETPWTLSLGA